MIDSLGLSKIMCELKTAQYSFLHYVKKDFSYIQMVTFVSQKNELWGNDKLGAGDDTDSSTFGVAMKGGVLMRVHLITICQPIT